MNPTHRLHPRRLVRDWRAWLLALFALYTIAGFVVVPLVAKRQITSQTRALLGCEASLKSLRFNPFTFNARARGFFLADRSGDSLATFDELHVNLAPWPALKRVVALEAVRVESPSVWVCVREGNVVNLLDLVPDTTRATASPSAAPEWVVRVDQLDVHNMTVDFDDVGMEPRVHAGLDSLDLALSGFASVPGDTVQFRLRTLLEHGGQVRATGWAMPLDFAADARVDVDSLSLKVADPYLRRQAHVAIHDGRLDVHGHLHAVAPPEQIPDGSFEGDIVVDDLHTFDTLKQQDFFGFKRLAVLQSQAGSLPPRAKVDEVLIEGIYARIAVAQDGSFNITDAFAPAIARADSIRAVSGVASDSAEVATMPDVAVGRIKIDGGEVDFSDLSLPLPFATRVHDVGGEITALAPDNTAGSRVSIQGTVDEHGLAKATGAVYAFDPRIFTDLRVDFRNIELTDLTPYSGKFMGYRIKRGKLTLGLNYDIKDSQLKGKNDIFLEKLTLGDKVESNEAVGLPVKLAIALLKDKNGNIDLDLEVAGDLNDPRVNTWSLVWQALKKVIVKITTAPFRFLGNLLGIGGDEMEFVEFEAGDADLTAPQHERLDNLAKALDERPALKLEVHGTWNKHTDAHALQARRFEDELAKRLVADAGGDSTAAAAAIKDPSSGPMQAALEELYTANIGAQKLAELRAAHTRAAGEGAEPTLNLASFLQAMRDALIEKVPVSEADLVQIADRRGAAIRGYLIEMKQVPPERVAVEENDVADDKDGEWVRCKLGLGPME